MAGHRTWVVGSVVENGNTNGGEAKEANRSVLFVDSAPIAVVRVVRVISAREPPDIALTKISAGSSTVPLCIFQPIGSWRRNIAKVATAVRCDRKIWANKIGALFGHQKRACMVVGTLFAERGSSFSVAEQRNAPIVVVRSCTLDLVIIVDDTFLSEIFSLVAERNHVTRVRNQTNAFIALVEDQHS